MKFSRGAILLGLGIFVGLLRGSLGCGPPQLPAGPAPEYERPKLAPWDAAPPPDPFDIVQGQADWVDDEPPADADAGAAETDASDGGESAGNSDAGDASGADAAGAADAEPDTGSGAGTDGAGAAETRPRSERNSPSKTKPKKEGETGENPGPPALRE